MVATNRHPGPVRPRHPSTQPATETEYGEQSHPKEHSSCRSTPIHARPPWLLGCLRGGADWVLSFSDASPNSHLRQTCFDSVRTLQESCLSSQSEASQLFITSRLRRRLPKPYRSQSLPSLSSLHLRTESLPLHLHLRYPGSSSHQIQQTTESQLDFCDNSHHTLPPD